MLKTTTVMAFALSLTLAGCASSPSSTITTSALPGSASTSTKPATPVRSTRSTQMYVWAGFKEKDCSPVVPQLGVTRQPAKGDVTFRPNETITVQHSSSGKCVGQSMAGTGIYYTAKKGVTGDDTFTVTASTPSGQTVTRTFKVNIVE